MHSLGLAPGHGSYATGLAPKDATGHLLTPTGRVWCEILQSYKPGNWGLSYGQQRLRLGRSMLVPGQPDWQSSALAALRRGKRSGNGRC